MLEQVDIQIAGRRGDVSQPAELRRPSGSASTGGQHVTQHLQHRPGTPHRDPELVQVLGVDVGDDPVDVGLHLGEVAEQRVGHGEIRGLAALHAEAFGAGWAQSGHGPERLEPGIASR